MNRLHDARGRRGTAVLLLALLALLRTATAAEGGARQLQQTCSASRTPAYNQRCIYDDGGRSCTAKEVYLTNATLVSPVDSTTGAALQTGPCCSNTLGNGAHTFNMCYTCTPGQRLRGTLMLWAHANADRYNLGIYLASNTPHNTCGQDVSDAYCAATTCTKIALDPQSTARLDNNCCGDTTQIPHSPAGVQLVPDHVFSVPDFEFVCPTVVPASSVCAGSAHFDYCLSWGQNKQDAVTCSTTTTTSPAGVVANSYTVSGPGTPSKCWCERELNVANLDVFMATCGKPYADSALPFICASGTVLDQGALAKPNPSQALCCVVAGLPDLSVMAVADGQALTKLAVNTTLNITVIVKNEGPVTAHNVTVACPLGDGVQFQLGPNITYDLGGGAILTVPQGLPPGCTITPDWRTIICFVGDVPSGGMGGFYGLVSVSQPGVLYSTVYVQANEPDANPLDNMSELVFSAIIPEAAPRTSVDVSVLADPVTTGVAGSTTSLQVTVSNNGSVHLAEDVVLTTQLSTTVPPSLTADSATCSTGCTCIIGSSGGDVTCLVGLMALDQLVSVNISTRPATAGNYTINATATATNDVATPDNNAASFTLVVAPGGNATNGTCAAGYWLQSADTGCVPCGWDYQCVDGVRTVCPLFLGTPNTTSAACQPLMCDPCPDDQPDVIVNTGSGSTPANSLWIIKSFAAPTVTPRFLCRLSGYLATDMLSDVALTYRGDVVAVDTVGNLRYVPGALYRTLVPQSAPTTRTCTTLSLGALPRGPSYTGLAQGLRTDELFASTAAGDVLAIKLGIITGGKLTATISTRIQSWCDPVAKAVNTGGTDIALSPDGQLYRFCARDAKGRYTASVFGIRAATQELSGTSNYTNFKLTNAVDKAFANAGAFCSKAGAFGVGTQAANGTTGLFWHIGGVGWQGRSVETLPNINEVRLTLVCAHRGVELPQQSLRLNGAANMPTCGGRSYPHSA